LRWFRCATRDSARYSQQLFGGGCFAPVQKFQRIVTP
jgi:hypothetical protein